MYNLFLTDEMQLIPFECMAIVTSVLYNVDCTIHYTCEQLEMYIILISSESHLKLNNKYLSIYLCDLCP